MKKVIIIIGLPASGKTYLGKSLGYPFYDDIWELPETNDEIFIITQPHFCRPYVLKDVEKQIQEKYVGYEIERIYFENDPETCIVNAHSPERNTKLVDGFIRRLTREYCIDHSHTVLPVWKSNIVL